jgi:AraC family transcriptional regulator, regulatory protein of adaptative response / methylated-DNA-[protein]-cysteine methyltransferase
MMHTALAHVMDINTDDDRWRAVLGRDRRADGRFVYAVASTGVFCRPSCPSRRPRRERVAFFASPDEATAAGYRPCRRCHPLDGDADPWPARIRLACRYLSRAESPLTLAALARRVGGSPFHLQRNFKRLVGVTPREFAEARRFDTVKRELRGQADVTTAVTSAGYGSSSRFYERAVPRLGMSPRRYRAGGTGESIRYAVVPSPLGRVLVGATERGVCAVSLGDSAAELVHRLDEEFPHARLIEDASALRGWTSQVIEHLAGRLPTLDLPLDIRATAFQWRVWMALRSIPPGETRTYAQVAASIGRPGSARAVARACATNPVALTVPCHRVVPVAGGVGGYRWGAGRKEALLAREMPSAAGASTARRRPAAPPVGSSQR